MPCPRPTFRLRCLAIACFALAASGCASVAVTLAGLGAGIGANHFIGSVSTRTFTHPQQDTKWATLGALKRMQVEVDSIEATGRAGELIKGRTSGREFEVELEPVSATVTRMKSLVRIEGSLTLDGATAAEIVAQTERALALNAAVLSVQPSNERMPEPPPVPTARATTLAAARPAEPVRSRVTAPAPVKPSPARPAHAPAAAAPPPPPQ